MKTENRIMENLLEIKALLTALLSLDESDYPSNYLLCLARKTLIEVFNELDNLKCFENE